jgi:hypothetical protein
LRSAGWRPGDEDLGRVEHLTPLAGGVAVAQRGGGRLAEFTLGDAFAVFDTVDGWRARFDDHAVVVLGASLVARGDGVDDRGRFPLLGDTARSVAKVELRYADGPALVADDVNGGFVLMVDAQRAREVLVVYDAAGQELERTDVSEFRPLLR